MRSCPIKWIKHDTDANQDAKLQNVLLDYGLEGYGLYWYCIELIAGKVDKDNITFELEHDARIIARNTGCTPQKVEEMMKYFVSIGLFENSHGVISCLKLAKRLDKSMTSNPEMRQIIQGFKNNHAGVMMASDEVMQEEIRLDEKRLVKQDGSAEPKEKRACQLPKNFEPNENNISTAKQIGADIGYQLQQFKDWHLAKGSKYKDWNKAFNTWIRKSAEFSKGRNSGSSMVQQQRVINQL